MHDFIELPNGRYLNLTHLRAITPFTVLTKLRRPLPRLHLQWVNGDTETLDEPDDVAHMNAMLYNAAHIGKE